MSKIIKKELTDLNPVEMFETIISDDVIKMILKQTILYARQNNRQSFQLNSACMHQEIYIIILWIPHSPI